MTKKEAKQQLEHFFRKIGINISAFEEHNFVKADIGEAVLGFVFLEAEGILKAEAFVYRFRRAPESKILKAIYAAANETNAGGGRISFDERELSLFLEMNFDEKSDDDFFYRQTGNLTRASLLWSSRILPDVAENIHQN